MQQYVPYFTPPYITPFGWPARPGGDCGNRADVDGNHDDVEDVEIEYIGQVLGDNLANDGADVACPDEHLKEQAFPLGGAGLADL